MVNFMERSIQAFLGNVQRALTPISQIRLRFNFDDLEALIFVYKIGKLSMSFTRKTIIDIWVGNNLFYAV